MVRVYGLQIYVVSDKAIRLEIAKWDFQESEFYLPYTYREA